MSDASLRCRQDVMSVVSVGLPAGLLLCSAVAKCYVLFRAPAAKLLVFGSFPATVALVCTEITIATWLMSGKRRKQALVVSAILFLIFAFFSLGKGLAGETSCSCFGVLETSPWVSMALDMIAVVCLIVAVTRNERILSSPMLRLAPEMGLVAAVSICGLLLLFGPMDFDAAQLNDQDRLIVIEPEKWIGKEFPLTQYVVRGKVLDEGDWEVNFLIKDCELCHALAEAKSAAASEAKIAFVEVPPFGTQTAQDSERIRWFRLTESTDWFVEAPVTVYLENGIVKTVTGRDEWIKWIDGNATAGLWK
jgi:hypothetical protein